MRARALAAGALLLTCALTAHAATPDSLATSSPRFGLVGSRDARPSPAAPRPALNPHGDIHIACERCHTAEGWTPLRDPLNFDHSEDTRFAMTGRHGQAACTSCHVDLRFDRPDLEPDACASCHLDVHQGQLGDDCQQCHTTQDFHLVRGVEIHARTAFPLTGAHLQVSCESCHEDNLDGAFAPLDPACIGCHADAFESTVNSAVNHVAAGFPTTCDACHNTLSFSTGAAFEHASVSGGFSLVGAHALIECSACHNPGDLAPLFQPASQNDCFACHQDDYEATATNALVDHPGANLPTDCQQCHTVEAWQGATADHVVLSGGFALVGAHLPLACDACHSGPDFSVPTDPASQDDCFACHDQDHQTAHPNFPTTCLDCHTTAAFQPATFDHVAVSGGFGLVGAHLSLPCSACHVGPDLDPIWMPASQDDCFTCHEDEHQEEHPDFPTTCLDCHSVDSWDGAAFNHEASTGFPLVGAHLSLTCESCHTGPDFTPIWMPSSADDCFTCHEDEHQEEHPAFPTTCLDCHNTTTWEGATFNHESTGFALVGAHLPLACESCHIGPDFGLINTPSGQDDCLACHAEDHEDEHPDFPTTCLDCHNTTTWDGATFNHQQATGFALVGAHVSLACESCHTGPDYQPIWTPSSQDDCFACHQPDHQQVHPSVSTACLDCHTTDMWQGATINHDPIFPIFSGRHEGEWATCQTCHNQPPSLQAFSCLTCHEHNRPEMDDRHEGVPGYVYESQACYSCHPDGED